MKRSISAFTSKFFSQSLFAIVLLFVISLLRYNVISLYIRNLRKCVSDFLHAILQGTCHHSFQHKGNVGLHRYLHLALRLTDWQHLNPEVEGYWRLFCLELDALILLALDDTEFDGTNRCHTDLYGVAVELELLQLILKSYH